MSLSVAGWRPAAAATARPNLVKFIGWTVLLLLIAAGVALPDSSLVVLGGIGLIVGVAAFIQPLVALPLLLLAVPFGSVAHGTTGTDSSELTVGATEAIVALLGAAWLARAITRRRISVWFGPPVLAVLAMVALALLSIGYAHDKGEALKESLRRDIENADVSVLALPQETDSSRGAQISSKWLTSIVPR